MISPVNSACNQQSFKGLEASQALSMLGNLSQGGIDISDEYAMGRAADTFTKMGEKTDSKILKKTFGVLAGLGTIGISFLVHKKGASAIMTVGAAAKRGLKNLIDKHSGKAVEAVKELSDDAKKAAQTAAEGKFGERIKQIFGGKKIFGKGAEEVIGGLGRMGIKTGRDFATSAVGAAGAIGAGVATIKNGGTKREEAKIDALQNNQITDLQEQLDNVITKMSEMDEADIDALDRSLSGGNVDELLKLAAEVLEKEEQGASSDKYGKYDGTYDEYNEEAA